MSGSLLGNEPPTSAIETFISLPFVSPPLRHRASTILCQVVPVRDSWHVLARLDSATFPMWRSDRMAALNRRPLSVVLLDAHPL